MSIHRLLLFILLGIGSAVCGMAQKADCLKYEPAVVQLIGRIVPHTFPGPPNYEDIKKGDRPERYWILESIEPFCVQSDDSNNDVNVPEKAVTKAQLVLSDYDRYKKLVGKRVIVRGTLFHAITAHHKTTILIQVVGIEVAVVSRSFCKSTPVGAW